MRLLRFTLGRWMMHAGLRMMPPGRVRLELTKLLADWGSQVEREVWAAGRERPVWQDAVSAPDKLWLELYRMLFARRNNETLWQAMSSLPDEEKLAIDLKAEKIIAEWLASESNSFSLQICAKP